MERDSGKSGPPRYMYLAPLQIILYSLKTGLEEIMMRFFRIYLNSLIVCKRIPSTYVGVVCLKFGIFEGIFFHGKPRPHNLGFTDMKGIFKGEESHRVLSVQPSTDIHNSHPFKIQYKKHLEIQPRRL